MYKHRHFGSYGLIIDEDKILLIRKSRGAYTGKLDLPGGSFEHGESPLETVKREIMEEVGVNVLSATLVDGDSCNVVWFNKERGEEEDLHHIGFIYMILIDDKENIKTGSDGLDSLGANWYSINDLKYEEVSPFTWSQLKRLGYK